MDRGKFIPAPKQLKFDGDDYDPVMDQERLTNQFILVREFAKGGHWHTLAEGSEATGAPEASYSAQLRNLRKRRFGGYTVEKRRRGVGRWGLYEYRLLKRKPS